MCERDGAFLMSHHCKDNEVCIGPSNARDATYMHETLCAQGKYNTVWLDTKYKKYLPIGPCSNLVLIS